MGGRPVRACYSTVSGQTAEAVLTDFAAYPEWNPLLPSVEARLVPGASVDMRARIGRRTLAMHAAMVTIRPGMELRWRGPRSRLLARLVRRAGFDVESFRGRDPAPDEFRAEHGFLRARAR